MSNEFHKYNSLVNVTDPKFINNMIRNGKDSGLWVALEKIHGSNFGLCTDGSGEVWHCTRTKRMGAADSLKGSSKLHKYDSDVLKIYDQLLEDEILVKGDQLIIRGEIFGGNFFGTSAPNTSVVQRGMSYHPDTEFMLYDIEIYPEADAPYGEGYTPTFLSYLDTILLLFDTEVSLLHVPNLGGGTLQEMLKLPNEFPSKVPEDFGLELPEGKIAPCEGFVIKPLGDNKFMHNGKRCILKNKNSKFDEKGGKPTKVRKEVNLSDVDKAVFEEFSTYINEVRLESVLSKLIEYTWKDFGMVMGLLVQDAKVDYESDHSINLKDSDTWTTINKLVTNLATQITRAYFEEHVSKH